MFTHAPSDLKRTGPARHDAPTDDHTDEYDAFDRCPICGELVGAVLTRASNRDKL